MISLMLHSWNTNIINIITQSNQQLTQSSIAAAAPKSSASCDVTLQIFRWHCKELDSAQCTMHTKLHIKLHIKGLTRLHIRLHTRFCLAMHRTRHNVHNFVHHLLRRHFLPYNSLWTAACSWFCWWGLECFLSTHSDTHYWYALQNTRIPIRHM